MSQIAARIRALREQAFFSQQRLSKTLGIAQSSLCRYETGETEPSAAVLLKYADFFDVSMDFLLLGKENYRVDRKQCLRMAIDILSELQAKL